MAAWREGLAAARAASAAASSVEERLIKLEELRKKVLITGEEYKKQREKILADT